MRDKVVLVTLASGILFAAFTLLGAWILPMAAALDALPATAVFALLLLAGIASMWFLARFFYRRYWAQDPEPATHKKRLRIVAAVWWVFFCGADIVAYIVLRLIDWPGSCVIGLVAFWGYFFFLGLSGERFTKTWWAR